MKENLESLINRIDEIESRFHKDKLPPGVMGSNSIHIYDDPEFQDWIQEIQYELQEILNHSQDIFIQDTLNTAKLEYKGIYDREYFSKLKGKLKVIEKHIDKYYPSENTLLIDTYLKQEKTVRIFISHSTLDKGYAERIVSLLEDMGLGPDEIFCSSVSGYDIPLGENIFDYLWKQFNEHQLHIIVLHSKNYYESAISLNEMGAAWVLRNKCTSFLLPGFNFDDMIGVIKKDNIAMKLDHSENELREKLNQLYEQIIEEFNLPKRNNAVWSRKRDSFINSIKDV